MMENFRRFDVGPDPFGRNWTVEFRWQQNAISIRHADGIDVKFQLFQGGDEQEKVIFLPHLPLLEVSRELGRPLTDAWVMKLAALHLRKMILTDEDMDKNLVRVEADDIRRQSAEIDRLAAASV
jgi:hypothetical protein